MDAEIAARILDSAAAAGPRCGTTTLVVIDGRSGAGKTTLATAVAALAQDQGLTTSVVHVDELCPGWNGLPAVPHRLEKLVKSIARTGDATYPTWDWYNDCPGPDANLGPSDVVVIEGASAADPRWATLTSVAVWVEAPPEVRKARAIARDGDSFAQHWESWAAAEDDYFGSRGSRKLDIVVDVT
jgi:uridine kinase